MRPLRICLTASELAPLAKTGGLADVCAALAGHLHGVGHDVRVLLPLYSSIDLTDVGATPVSFLQNLGTDFAGRRIGFSIDTGHLPGTDTPIYLLRCDELYRRNGIYPEDGDEHRRFLMLCRATIAMCQHMGWSPDIVHCNDWHTAMVPVLLKNLFGWDSLFANTKSVLTIHNIGFQGVFGADILDDTGMAGRPDRLHQEDLSQGRINFLKNGLLYADHLTTVSPTYAREIQTADFGFGLEDMLRWRNDHLTGILNGVDYAQWDPANDTLIP
ncbi:MAG: glycogen/starch synthase, partial [Pseudomonadota bacterium]